MTDIKLKVDLFSGLIEYKGDPNVLESTLKTVTKTLGNFDNPKKSNKPARIGKPKSPNSAKKKSAKPIPEKDPDLEPTTIANNVKTHADAAMFQSKIIQKPKDFYNKCKFILYITGKPMSSGQIHRTLEALNIKASLSAISKALSNHKDELLTSGTSPEQYSLTAPLKVSLEEWLMADDTGE